MTNLIDEKRLEELRMQQMHGHALGLHTPEDYLIPEYQSLLETLAAALRVVEKAKDLCRLNPGHMKNSELEIALKPFSESHTSARGEDATKEK